MKKLKLIPGILLLGLCLAVLGVGIYAVAPASNSISGRLKVRAANAEVVINTYLNSIGEDNKLSDELTTRTSGTIDLDKETLEFVRNESYYDTLQGQTNSLAEANTIDEVDDITIFVEVKNNSEKKLGVYFSTQSLTDDLATVTEAEDQATAEANIATSKSYQDGLVTTALTGYVPLEASDLTPGEEVYSTVIVKMVLHLTHLVEDEFDINVDGLYLNVEPYMANVTKEMPSTYSGLSFAVTDNSTLQASVSSNEATGAVTFPTDVMVNGKHCTVTSVASNGFANNTNITAVTIPEQVSTVGSGAFAGCTSLATVTIENANVYTQATSMDGAGGLLGTAETVRVLASVDEKNTNTYLNNANNFNKSAKTTIGTKQYYTYASTILDASTYSNLFFTFYGDTASVRAASTSISGAIVIPEMVKDNGNVYTVDGLEREAFKNCTSMTSLVIPNTISYLDNKYYDYLDSVIDYFKGCSNLEEIVIPTSVVTIASGIFDGCTKLQYTEGDYTYIKAKETVDGAVNNYFAIKSVESSITNYTINPNTKFILEEAFKNCSNITSMTVPGTIRGVGGEAFPDGLTSLTINEGVLGLSCGFIDNCLSGLTSLSIPSSIEMFWGGDYYNFPTDGSEDIYYIRDSMMYMGNETNHFVILIGSKDGGYYHEDLDLELPYGLKIISKTVITDDSGSVKSLTIPNTVRAICGDSFYCFTVGNYVDDVYDGVILIPDSVIYLGYRSLTIGCASITLGSGITMLPSYFTDGWQYYDLYMSDSITRLDNFSLPCNSDEVFSVKRWSNSIKYISPKAFDGDGGYRLYYYVEQFVDRFDIYGGAYYLCNYKFLVGSVDMNATSCTIHPNTITIGPVAFYNAYLTSIDLLNVKCIGDGAFGSECNFESLTIPSSVCFMDSSAIYSSTVESVTFAKTTKWRQLSGNSYTPVSSSQLISSGRNYLSNMIRG